MNYELFNDAMVRLGKAQEDMQTAIRDAFRACIEVSTETKPIYGQAIEDKEEINT